MSEQDPPLQVVEKPHSDERLAQLLNGEAEPPNEFARWCLSEVVRLGREGQSVDAQLTQARTLVRKLEEKLLTTQGAYNKAKVDLERWDRELKPKQESEAS